MKLKRRLATYEDEPYGSPARGKLFSKELSGPASQCTAIVVLIALGLALGIMTGSWRDFARGFRDFEQAQGVITSLSPPREQRGKRGTTYDVDAQYSFAVNGQVHTGSTVGRAGRCSLRGSEERALRDNYQRGVPVTIRYAKADPTDSFIEVKDMDARHRVGSLVGSVVGAGLTGLGVVCLGLLIVRGPVRYRA
jgi:hypothetical protein